jgi:hypothetical protein
MLAQLREKGCVNTQYRRARELSAAHNLGSVNVFVQEENGSLDSTTIHRRIRSERNTGTWRD